MAAVPVATVWIHGLEYDITNFEHPGGQAWLTCVAGKDATTHFEVHHMRIELAQARLATLPVVTVGKSSSLWDWSELGFYARLRRRARLALLKNAGETDLKEEDVVDVSTDTWHRATTSTKAMQITRILAVILYILVFITTCAFQSPLAAISCGVMAAVMGGFGHSAFHQRGRTWDCWLFECAGLSHFEWRTGNHTAHHVAPNLHSDPDTVSMLPFVEWGPPPSESTLYRRFVAPVAFHVAAALAVISMQGAHVMCPSQIGRSSRSNSGLFIPTVMLFLLVLSACSLQLLRGSNDTISMLFGTLNAVGLWAVLWLSGSLYFMLVTSVTHNQESNWTAHFGLRDWGAWQMAASTDIEIPCGLRGVPFFAMWLIFLHEQTLHHLFPSIDHSRLHALRPLVAETATEFGLELKPPQSYLSLYLGMIATIRGIPTAKKV